MNKHSWGKEHEKRKDRKNEIAKLREKCTYDNCKEKARCVINGKFFCVQHFFIVRRELKERFGWGKCPQCHVKFKKSEHAKSRKFCSIECRIKYHQKVQNG